MIAEASVKWGISPKVILATLQKEQSLLTAKNPSQNAMDWAMGCGKADSFTTYKYQGFGKQIYYGAEKFKQNAALWKPGASQKIDGSTVYPTNPGTHAQYRYTPHFPGVMSFWMIYWRYFGDPLSPRPRPVTVRRLEVLPDVVDARLGRRDAFRDRTDGLAGLRCRPGAGRALRATRSSGPGCR